MIFDSEVLQIACGAWAGAEGMGGLSLAFVPGIAVSFYLRKRLPSVLCGQAKTTCVRVASFSSLQLRSSHQVSPPGSRAAVPLYSRRGRLMWNTPWGESGSSGQLVTGVQDFPVQHRVPSSSPTIGCCAHREGFSFQSNKEDFFSRMA